MPLIYDTFATTVVNGVASGDSVLIQFALYAPGELIDPNDGAELRIVDSDGDGLISRSEFRDATSGGGYGLNGGSDQLLFDGDRGGNNGTLYSPSPVADGTDLSPYLGDLTQNFTPVAPDTVDAIPGDTAPDDDPLCLRVGTTVLTPGGPRAVETLGTGDQVVTLNAGPQPIPWISRRRITTTGRSAPVRIADGALGHGRPERDLMVSPQHRVLLCSRALRNLTGTACAIAPRSMWLGCTGSPLRCMALTSTISICYCRSAARSMTRCPI